MPYIKDWIDSHPQRNNKNTYLIPTLDRHSRNFGNRLASSSLNVAVYRKFKLQFFPSLLNDPKVPKEDNEKISGLLQKPWNPYVRRHSSLTEKSTILKFHTFDQHASWTPVSNMHLKYTHYFGNESGEELLESYGLETNTAKKDKDALLRPKQCPNCNESNISDAKFCAKCRMVLTNHAFSETLGKEKEKEDKLATMEKEFIKMQSQIRDLILAVIKTKHELDFETLRDHNIPTKEAATATTPATDYLSLEKEMQKRNGKKDNPAALFTGVQLA